MRTKVTAGVLGSGVAVVLGLWFAADVQSASTLTRLPAGSPAREEQPQGRTEMSDEDSNIATVGRPAVFTLMPAKVTGSPDPAKAGYVVLNVLGFTPPAEGSVTAVVKLRDEAGSEDVLGNFGLFPANTEFRAETAEDAQRFVFQLPEDEIRSLGHAPLQLSVELVPNAGETSAKARLEFGGVEFQQY
jgi:hypothetical protein